MQFVRCERVRDRRAAPPRSGIAGGDPFRVPADDPLELERHVGVQLASVQRGSRFRIASKMTAVVVP